MLIFSHCLRHQVFKLKNTDKIEVDIESGMVDLGEYIKIFTLASCQALLAKTCFSCYTMQYLFPYFHFLVVLDFN